MNTHAADPLTQRLYSFMAKCAARHHAMTRHSEIRPDSAAVANAAIRDNHEVASMLSMAAAMWPDIDKRERRHLIDMLDARLATWATRERRAMLADEASLEGRDLGQPVALLWRMRFTHPCGNQSLSQKMLAAMDESAARGLEYVGQVGAEHVYLFARPTKAMWLAAGRADSPVEHIWFD